VRELKNKALCSKVFLGLSGVCVFMAILGAAGTDIYLASTQWILVSILFAVYSFGCHNCSC